MGLFGWDVGYEVLGLIGGFGEEDCLEGSGLV